VDEERTTTEGDIPSLGSVLVASFTALTLLAGWGEPANPHSPWK